MVNFTVFSQMFIVCLIVEMIQFDEHIHILSQIS